VFVPCFSSRGGEYLLVPLAEAVRLRDGWPRSVIPPLVAGRWRGGSVKATLESRLRHIDQLESTGPIAGDIRLQFEKRRNFYRWSAYLPGARVSFPMFFGRVASVLRAISWLGRRFFSIRRLPGRSKAPRARATATRIEESSSFFCGEWSGGSTNDSGRCEMKA